MVQSGSQLNRLGARRIYAELRDQILTGVYAAGAALPSSRGLAGDLGVSRTTVTAAFEQLAAEGLIEVRQGARPRVASAPDAPAPSRSAPPPVAPRLSAFGERLRAEPPWRDWRREDFKVDFRYGDLAPEDFPTLPWKRAMGVAISRRPRRLAYADPQGSARLRGALQAYLWRARAVRCTPDQIVIVNGSQQGLALCAQLLLDPRDRFAIEDPCYAMARRIFAAQGARPVPIPVDADGMQVEALAGVEARLAYVTPSHQFPLGGVMRLARRRALLDWARETGARVIEDDYDSEYRYDIAPIPPLHALDGGAGSIYVGTVSKTLSPQLRLGYVVAPPELVAPLVAAKQLVDRHAPGAEQEALADLIESGAYEGHVRRVRRRNGSRRATLLRTLAEQFGDRVQVEGAEAGLHLVAWLRDLPRDAEPAAIQAARRAGVGLHPVSPLYDPHGAGPPNDRLGFVLGYAALSEQRIESGVRLLAEAIDALGA